MAGHPLFLLISLARELKQRGGVEDFAIPQNESMHAPNEDHVVGRRKVEVMPSTHKDELIAAELYNWCGEVLDKIGRGGLETDEGVYKYMYQMLAVMYRCTRDDKPVLLHDNHRRLIEENMFRAVEAYFASYAKHQGEFLKMGLKDDIITLNMSRHMFCKYPFLKQILNP